MGGDLGHKDMAVCAGKLLDGGDAYSAGREFGQDELMCRDMERSAMLRAAEALGATARFAW
jgi:hypothetical protein